MSLTRSCARTSAAYGIHRHKCTPNMSEIQTKNKNRVDQFSGCNCEQMANLTNAALELKVSSVLRKHTRKQAVHVLYFHSAKIVLAGMYESAQ